MKHTARLPRYALALGVAWLVALSVPARAAEPALTVASLSTVLSDVARRVGGERVRVVEIVRPGIDPHEFQPSPSDVQAVAKADILLISGKGLEGYLAKLEQSAGGGSAGKFVDVRSKWSDHQYTGGKYVNIGDALGVSLKLQEEGRTVDDPHWWHSFANVRRATELVQAVFVQADPRNAQDYATHGAAYVNRLAAAENDVKLKVAELPRDRRKLVTSHDAFGYLARDYGFTVYPVEGVSTSDEPSSRQVAALLDTIRREKVKAVFFENTQNPKVLATITRETGATVGGELYADGLGAPDSDAATYEGMMRHNVETIVNALK